MPLDARKIRDLRDAKAPIVILTGAGISRESGLHTFRDPDGIWSKVRIEDVATAGAFARNPDRVHAFYNDRRSGLLLPGVRPNPAHQALARLERCWPGPVTVVTQNIDDLHERAGTRTLIHMHGELLRARCGHCGNVNQWREDLGMHTPCLICGHMEGMRPHVVWFGEMPLEMDRIEAALAEAGLFVSIGTSGTVYPAAGFVAQVPPTCETVELNLEPSEASALFRWHRHGEAGLLVPEFVAGLIDA